MQVINQPTEFRKMELSFHLTMKSDVMEAKFMIIIWP